MEHRWDTADAWVFAAIAIAGAEASLPAVVSAADGINHAILGYEEYVVAVGRLVAAGLVDVDPAASRHRLTVAGEDLRRYWKGGLFGWIKTIPPALERLGPPPPAGWDLPAAVFEAAVHSYLKPQKARKARSSPEPDDEDLDAT